MNLSGTLPGSLRFASSAPLLVDTQRHCGSKAGSLSNSQVIEIWLKRHFMDRLLAASSTAAVASVCTFNYMHIGAIICLQSILLYKFADAFVD